LVLDGTTGIISVTPTTAGTFNFTLLVIDGELSASRALSISVAEALPDLVVESLIVTPPNPTFDNPVSFTAVVRNRGIGPAGPSEMVFWISTYSDLYYTVGALGPGESSAPITATYTFGPSDGPDQFVDAWADNNGTGGDIVESNESNNRKLVNFTVTGFGALDHFEFSAIPSTQHSDVPFPITILAKDALGEYSDHLYGDEYIDRRGGDPEPVSGRY